MNWDEYNKLFHKLELNLVAFQPLLQCDQEVLRLVNAAIAEEREACLKICSETKKNVTAKTNAGTILSHVIYHIKQREKKAEA